MTNRNGMSNTKAERLEKGREYVRSFRRSSNRIKALTSDLIAAYGVTGPQYLGLLWISDHAGLTQAELTIEVDSDANTVSALIRRLESKGLIIRRQHPSDRRAFTLFATASGKKLVSEIRPKIDRLSLHLFSLLPAGHEEAIAAWLASIAAMRELP